jgi:SWI/SNF-related matrix-associated actin-dependent regulator 1 of chromatin subfamily A
MPPENRIKLSWVDTQYGRRIAVIFNYDPALVAALQAIEKGSRWFDKEGKNSKGFKNAWLIRDDADILDDLVGRLEEVSPRPAVEIDPELAAGAQAQREKRKDNYQASRAASAEIAIPTKIPLYPFQKAGVKWIDDHGGRALVGDEMGLGKTCQALGWVLLHKEEALPALVVSPSTLRVNWRKEVAKFTDLTVLIMTAKSSLKAFLERGIEASERPLDGYDIVVVNYDLFRWADTKKGPDDIEIGIPKDEQSRINGLLLSEFGRFKTVIWDEFHRCKDGQSQRSRVALDLSKKMKYVLGLTGTPLMNRPIEIFHPMKCIRPDVFPNVIEFGKKFCNGFTNRFGWDFSGASNLEELDKLLRSKGGMIRRTKDQVLTELPPKTIVTIPIMLEGKLKDYEKAARPLLEKLARQKAERDEWRAELGAMTGGERKTYLAEHAEEASGKNKLTGYMIDEIEKVKQAAVAAKFDECMKFVLDLQENVGKLLLFTCHHETTDRAMALLAKEGVKAEVIDGRVDQADRDPIKDRFQEGDTQVLVCGIRAASEGLTLTAASNVVFFEFDWNPEIHEQAIARVHRISQTKAVTAYYLIALGTIEEKIASMIDAKREIVNATVGESERTLSEEGIMDAILDDVLEKVA